MRKYRKTRWLNTTVFPCWVALCLCPKEFDAICKEYGTYPQPFINNSHSSGAMHTFQSKHGLRCVVTIRDFKGRSKDAVYGLLIHEAVHIEQRIAENIGEDKWGIETQAYLTQCIAQWLMWNFDELSKIK